LLLHNYRLALSQGCSKLQSQEMGPLERTGGLSANLSFLTDCLSKHGMTALSGGHVVCFLFFFFSFLSNPGIVNLFI
jgi:hypothetical protein